MERSVYASEWKIMECLWDKAPQTLMQIVRAMKEETGWAKSTVTTMLTRMEAKGLLRHEDGGRAKLFYPAVTRGEIGARETSTLLQKLYNGSVGMLMSALVEQKGLTQEEIDELYAILKRAEGERNEHA